jgi:hypothetical protein
MCFKEATKGFNQKLVQIGCPTFFDKRKSASHEFRRELDLDHDFAHDLTLAGFPDTRNAKETAAV